MIADGVWPLLAALEAWFYQFRVGETSVLPLHGKDFRQLLQFCLRVL